MIYDVEVMNPELVGWGTDMTTGSFRRAASRSDELNQRGQVARVIGGRGTVVRSTRHARPRLK